MNIINYPSPNFWRANNKIRAIVLHGTSGPLTASLYTLTNPRTDNPSLAVSSNYLIDLNGDIYRFMSWWNGYRAFANGNLLKPDLGVSWIKECKEQGINPNFVTLSIEHVASRDAMLGHKSMTDQQFASSTWLTGKLLSDNGLRASSETVVGHYQLDSVNKRFCPGVINIPAYTQVLKDRGF